MYSIEMEIAEALQEAFRAALVLTGSIENAECTLMDAIATIGPDGSREALLLETARAALTCKALPDKSSPPVPPELQALFLLSPRCRYSFVLLVLMRLDLKSCSEILRMPANEVKEALCQSLQDLHKVQSAMPPGRIN
jgi:hypothetical protein